MKEITRENWIALGAGVAIVVGFVALVFVPQQGRLQSLRSDITAQKQRLETASQEVAVVPTLMEEIEAMQARYNDFDRQLPRKQDLGEFLGTISETVAQKGLTGQLTEPGNPVRGDLFHTLPINMRFRGDYLSTGSFLKDLQSMERLTRIQRLQIARDVRTEDPNGPLDIEMQINIYFTES
jgi:Tfp pilus assembly protein PilO